MSQHAYKYAIDHRQHAQYNAPHHQLTILNSIAVIVVVVTIIVVLLRTRCVYCFLYTLCAPARLRSVFLFFLSLFSLSFSLSRIGLESRQSIGFYACLMYVQHTHSHLQIFRFSVGLVRSTIYQRPLCCCVLLWLIILFCSVCFGRRSYISYYAFIYFFFIFISFLSCMHSSIGNFLIC